MRPRPIAALLIYVACGATGALFGSALVGSALVGCGATGTDEGSATPSPPEPALDPATDEGAAAADEPAPEAAPEVEEPEPTPPPRPEPIEVEAGVRLGPVRIGMTEEELGALGLEETQVDPRTRAYGPYRVRLDDGAVERVEAFLGDLGRIRIGEHVFDTESHIHRIRDAAGDCVWQEGGGERYRCRDGHLWVETTHSLAPARYAIRVE